MGQATSICHVGTLGQPWTCPVDKVVPRWAAAARTQHGLTPLLPCLLLNPATVEPERVREAAAARGYDVTAAVIQQLEASLSSSPTQQRQQQTAGQHGSQQQERQQQR